MLEPDMIVDHETGLTEEPAGHVCGTAPLLRHHEQRCVSGAPEHAREAAAVKLDRLEHLTALADPHAAPVRDIPVPDGAFGVEADAIRDTAVEIGPHALAGQGAVGRDIERR